MWRLDPCGRKAGDDDRREDDCKDRSGVSLL